MNALSAHIATIVFPFASSLLAITDAALIAAAADCPRKIPSDLTNSLPVSYASSALTSRHSSYVTSNSLKYNISFSLGTL